MSITTVYNVIKQTRDEKGKKVFNGICMLISPIILFITEFLLLNVKIFEEYTSLILILNGIIFGFLTCKMIITTMTKVNFLFKKKERT